MMYAVMLIIGVLVGYLLATAGCPCEVEQEPNEACLYCTKKG